MAAADAAPPRKRARAEEGAAWPRESLFFRHWDDDPAYSLIHDALVERGWKYRGDPCGKDLRELSQIAEGKRPAPRRCLWLLTEPEARMLRSIQGGASRHRINCFVGTDAACYKTSFSAAFRDADFFPKSYVLPDERRAMLAHLRAAGTSAEYWVVKPKNDFGGKGVVVYGNGKELQTLVARREQVRHVAQLYIARPYLVSGYKSHIRLYLCITNMHPLRAYLWDKGDVMFATKPYSLSRGNVGANFDTLSHLTNYSINATPANLALFMANKPGIGRGTCWTTAKFLAHVHRTLGIPQAQVWDEMRRISLAFARYIATHSNVVRHRGGSAPGRHHELYGLDVLLDRAGKVWLLEGNTDCGLEYCEDDVAGDANPDAGDDDDIMIHDLHALLGIDGYTKKGRADRWWCLAGGEAG